MSKPRPLALLGFNFTFWGLLACIDYYKLNLLRNQILNNVQKGNVKMVVSSENPKEVDPNELMSSFSFYSTDGLISEYLSWFFISCFMYLIYKKLSKLKWLRVTIIYIIASPIFIVGQEFLKIFLEKSILFLKSSLQHDFWEEIRIAKSVIRINTFFDSLFLYIFIVAGLMALDFYRKYREQEVNAFQLEGALTQAQLQHLKMQLQPHFLFNALNTVTMLVRRKLYENAIDVTTGLSDLLRSSLTVEKKQFITLDEEMDLIRKYLTIEKVRFTDKLLIEIDVDPSVKSALIPNLLLQPIVENAFKHGLSKSLKNNLLKINAQKIEQNVSVSVYNMGPYLDPQWSLEQNKGIGLTNTKERLQRLFGDKASFEIKNHDQGVRVTLFFPLTREYHGVD